MKTHQRNFTTTGIELSMATGFFISIICLILAGCSDRSPASNDSSSDKGAFSTNSISDPLLVARLVGRVVGVHDGDTITVLGNGKVEYRVRLSGIDAPELEMDFGRKSKENLSNLVFGKEVSIASNKTDRYGRIVGLVFLEAEDIGLEQVKVGLAWHYKQFEMEQTVAERLAYTMAEAAAREARLGLWTLSTAIPPWDFRLAKDEENISGVPDGAIIGNKNSMIYHTPGCSTYRKTSPKNQVLFLNESDAIAGGFRKAKNCG